MAFYRNVWAALSTWINIGNTEPLQNTYLKTEQLTCKNRHTTSLVLSSSWLMLPVYNDDDDALYNLKRYRQVFQQQVHMLQSGNGVNTEGNPI